MVSMIERQVKYLALGNGYIVGVINAKMVFYHLMFYSWMKRRKKNRQLARGKGKLKLHMPGLEGWWEGDNLCQDVRLRSGKG